ncbi:MAG: LamG domain-containing protein [Planctomycetaceae bacterium]
MVSGGGYVYGYGRKPEHLRWTTVLEHQLFAAGTDPPGVESVDDAAAGKPGRSKKQATGVSTVRFEDEAVLDPTGQPLTIEAWVRSDKPNGVVLSHGAAQWLRGWLSRTASRCSVCTESELSQIKGAGKLGKRWHHVVATLDGEARMTLYVDGKVVASGVSKGPIPKKPAQTLQLAADEGGTVGDYESPFGFTGLLDEVRVYHASLTPAQVQARADGREAAGATPVLALTLDEEVPSSTTDAHLAGSSEAVTLVGGHLGKAYQFTGAGGGKGGGAQPAGTNVEHKWASDVPVYVRAMALADRQLVIVGPPDIINEHETFARLSARDTEVNELLNRQNSAAPASRGASCW